MLASPEEALLDAALDPTLSHYERMRATSLLGTQTRGPAGEYLGLLADAGDPAVRRTAVYTLAVSFGPLAPEDVLRRVAVHLRDPDPSMRSMAARAVARIPSPLSAATLRSALVSEADPSVRAMIESRLGRLDKKPAK
jgi:HEAT repeat protein